MTDAQCVLHTNAEKTTITDGIEVAFEVIMGEVAYFLNKRIKST